MQIDTVGVPEFWASNIEEVEVVDDGLVRLVVCTTRHGERIPVTSVVMPAAALLRAIPNMSDFCRRSLGDRTGVNH